MELTVLSPLMHLHSFHLLPFSSQGVDVFIDQPQGIFRGVQKLQHRPIDQVALVTKASKSVRICVRPVARGLLDEA